MAFHFSGNQYEQAYKPPVLRNWEVPKYYVKDKQPLKRSGKTKIISNDKGHLLPGIPRLPNSPWGEYVGTWDLPRRIDRATANELSGLNKFKKAKQKQLVKKSDDTTILVEPEKAIPTVEPIVEEVEAVKEVETVKELPPPPEPIPEDHGPYIPGDLTEKKYRLPLHDLLEKNRASNFRDSSSGYPKYRDDFSKPLPKLTKPQTRDEVEKMYQEHKKMFDATFCPIHDHNKSNSNKPTNKKPSSSLMAAIKNFQMAKTLHKVNLEHDPLPDTITNLKYRKLQMQQMREPGLALENGNFATGVGWKGYPGYGPNRCTKLKVYRPKTCLELGKKSGKTDERPSSVSSFDLKWRFIRQKKVTPIELAICWDMTPENVDDEPKRTTHIDGSNGSKAPAVFSLVHTPKGDEVDEMVVEPTNNSSIFGKGPERGPNDKEFVLDRPKTCVSSKSSSSIGKRAKSAYNLNQECNEIEELGEKCSNCSNVGTINQNWRQSTPNLSEVCGEVSKGRRPILPKAKLCMACEMKKLKVNDYRSQTKNEYKMAFKAGVPQKVRCVSNYFDNLENCANRFGFKVPKQKDPYPFRKYEIRSLAPPFSLQKDKREDYPEHWRLATVYQHSYKPIHARKRPLLATVYK